MIQLREVQLPLLIYTLQARGNMMDGKEHAMDIQVPKPMFEKEAVHLSALRFAGSIADFRSVHPILESNVKDGTPSCKELCASSSTE